MGYPEIAKALRPVNLAGGLLLPDQNDAPIETTTTWSDDPALNQ